MTGWCPAKLKDNRETTIRQEEIVNKLKLIKEELLSMMKAAFDALDPSELPQEEKI